MCDTLMTEAIRPARRNSGGYRGLALVGALFCYGVLMEILQPGCRADHGNAGGCERVLWATREQHTVSEP